MIAARSCLSPTQELAASANLVGQPTGMRRPPARLDDLETAAGKVMTTAKVSDLKAGITGAWSLRGAGGCLFTGPCDPIRSSHTAFETIITPSGLVHRKSSAFASEAYLPLPAITAHLARIDDQRAPTGTREPLPCIAY